MRHGAGTVRRSERSSKAARTAAFVAGLTTFLIASTVAGQPETEPPADDPEGDLPTPTEVEESPTLPPPAEPTPPPTPTTIHPYNPPPPPTAAEDKNQETASDDVPPATLFDGDKEVVLGGFGGLSVRYTRVLGNDAVWVGGEGALLLNHAFSVGLGGGGIANEINPTNQTRLDFGYGGLILRYHFFSNEVVNFAVGGLIGGGSIAVYDRDIDHDDVDWEKVSEAVFVFEPELGLYLNFTRWMRVGVTGGYRFVSGVEKNDLSDTDVRGAAGGASIQFGWF